MVSINNEISAILKRLTPEQLKRVNASINLSDINIMNLSEAEARNLLAKIKIIAGIFTSNPIAEGLQASAVEDREKAQFALNTEEACRKHCESLRKNLPPKDSPDYEKAEMTLRMAEIDLECASMDREYRVKRANHTEMCADIATKRSSGLNFLG